MREIEKEFNTVKGSFEGKEMNTRDFTKLIMSELNVGHQRASKIKKEFLEEGFVDMRKKGYEKLYSLKNNDCKKENLEKILVDNGLDDWEIKYYDYDPGDGGFCDVEGKKIYLLPGKFSFNLFLHEVAHALCPNSRHGLPDFEATYIKLVKNNGGEISHSERNFVKDHFGWDV